jgi:superfamily I DNA and/or RNA helicase
MQMFQRYKITGRIQPKYRSSIKVGSVEAFQGLERDFIILSTVVTKPSRFVSNECRVNVAISRAKKQLVVVCHKRTLLEDPVWKHIIPYFR